MTRSDFSLSRAQLASVNWPAVALFYAIACGLSFALRHVPNPTEGILPMHTIFTYGLGPIVAALVTRLVYPAMPQRITLLGHRPAYSLLLVVLPLVIGIGFGVTNKHNQDPHVYGGLLVVSGILYGFVEEMGWRGFLHNAFRSLPAFWRVLFTAALWGGWHLTFLTDAAGVAGPGVPIWALVGVFILAAWGLGLAAEQSRSVLVVACLHEAFNMTNSSVGLGLILLGWTILLKIWPKQPRLARSATTPVGVLAVLVGGLLLFIVKPVQAQSETIPHQEIDLSDNAKFPLFNDDFYKNQLFLLGETHGFKNAQVVDLALLKHLNQRVGVRHYIAEVDPTKAYYINQYLQTGQDSTLRLVFASWIAETMQWANADFFRKIQAIRVYNQTLPKIKRIRFVGIDAVQDRPLIARQLLELAGNQLVKADEPRLDSLVSLLRMMPAKLDSLAAQVALNWLVQIKNHPADYRKLPAETLTELCATLQTLGYRKTIRSPRKNHLCHLPRRPFALQPDQRKALRILGRGPRLAGSPSRRQTAICGHDSGV